MTKYSVGVDYGTNSVRALVVDVHTGREIGDASWNYEHGTAGVVLDPRQPDLARQHPADYLKGLEKVVKAALAKARRVKGFSPAHIVGIGVDTTGSTPLPVDRQGEALALKAAFANHPAAMAWLWKDHTSHEEAARITAEAARRHPEFLAPCGGTYSSEWFWSKLWHCRRTAPRVFQAAYTWVELADWIPAVLTGNTAPERIRRGICAAGHKAMFNAVWGGYPPVAFWASLDKELARVRRTLPERAYTIAEAAGKLTAAWARRLGLPQDIPVAVGAFDAHMGAVGSGIGAGTLVKIIGTSSCDIAVEPIRGKRPDIPGLCGIVPGSVLPDCLGLEAGQSAVGDIFNWLVNVVRPGGESGGGHAELTKGAMALAPGASGLLALDWHNGNRTVLVDQRLTGLLLGLTLHSTPAEIYRALIEATAFGARVIVERLEAYGVRIKRVVNCGGISAKSPLVMQIYADVLNRPMEISSSTQTCALGAAMAGAVVGGAHGDFCAAARRMTRVLPRRFKPIRSHTAVYDKLFALYKIMHDGFGTQKGASHPPYVVMKELLALRDAVRQKAPRRTR